MKYTILLNGEQGNHSFSLARAEYEKRLSPYCKIQCISSEQTDTAAYIQDKAYKIFIPNQSTFHYCQTISSEDFANKLLSLTLHGTSHIQFYVDMQEAICSEAMRISNMEIASPLISLLLYEQIYRSYMILNNRPYHK